MRLRLGVLAGLAAMSGCLPGYFLMDNLMYSPVPEPGTVLLFLLMGACVLGAGMALKCTRIRCKAGS